MLKKNQIHVAEITGYTSDGAGVCRIEGRAVFVKGTIVGEIWEVRILKVSSSAVYGKGARCLSPSAMRQEPPCPVYRKCGGCSLLHMTYDEELHMKRERVNDALQRIGGLAFQISDILGAAEPSHYRNKAIYNVSLRDGKPVKGFYRASTHEVTPVENCLLQKPLADRGIRPNAVVVDPPRKGMSSAAIEAVVSMEPERIVYVSCDPGTLARDLKLLHALGYFPAEGVAVDMFPHTPHVETVCCLYHQKKDFIAVPYEPKNADYLKQLK